MTTMTTLRLTDRALTAEPTGEAIDTDILVVGAGPAGLATAITAARHGARVLVVERRAGTSTVPRATGVSTHTMELFRIWGIADAVRAASVACEPTMAVRRTLATEPMAVVPLGFPSLREALQASPELPALCPQDLIEPLLADRLRALGGQIRFGAQLTGLRYDAAGALLAAVSGHRVRARFMVGADGPRSTVRSLLRIGVEPLGTLGGHALVVFRPDVAALPGGRPHALNTIVGDPEVEGILLPAGAGRWIYSRPWSVAESGRPGDRPPGYWARLIRSATGLGDLQPQILEMTRFTMAAEAATAYRQGAGFLVGDAAHRMTPVGGRGMNTAIHDGHELGWRLAWAVRGLAGEALLDSYQAEREPVGRANAGRSLRRGEPDPGDGLAADLFGTYRSAVVAEDGADASPGVYHRDARPGQRAPHVWLRLAGRRTSTLDLFENRMTLVTGQEGSPWRRAAHGLQAGPPVRALVVGHDLADDRGHLRRVYRLGDQSAVLVRPDGVIAWRHDGPCQMPGAALASALSTALGLEAGQRAEAV
jgi:2-polyprenyl-6-methoxyphenol hydroxylase-like FAD-dependent oxidoreductase